MKLLLTLTSLLVTAELTSTAQTPGSLLWSFPNGGSFSCPIPAVGADGTIYVTAEPYLYALTPGGAKKWQFTPTGSSAAIGDDGTIYFGSSDGRLYALNSDGSLKWTFQPTGHIQEDLAIGLDGAVYFVADDGYCYAVNSDGTERWSYHVGDDYPSPAIGTDGTIYCGSGASVVAINPNGTLKWGLNTLWPYNASPAIGYDGTLYFGAAGSVGFGSVQAVGPNGTLEWYAGANLQSSVVLGTNGTIYTLDLSLTELNAIDLTTQTVLWRRGGGDNGRGYLGIPSVPAVAADGTIYFGTYDFSFNAALYAMNPDGSTNWVFASGGQRVGSPCIAHDGTVYVTADTGFFALKGAAPLAPSPWPKFHQNLRNTGKLEHPRLLNPHSAPDAFDCLVFGEVWSKYAVQSSSDLTNWFTVTNFTATTNLTSFAEHRDSGTLRRFYRALSQAQ